MVQIDEAADYYSTIIGGGEYKNICSTYIYVQMSVVSEKL